jgi:hypothetical protein
MRGLMETDIAVKIHFGCSLVEVRNLSEILVSSVACGCNLANEHCSESILAGFHFWFIRSFSVTRSTFCLKIKCLSLL